MSEFGYFFPESVGKTNHYKLAIAAYGSIRKDDLLIQHRLDTKEKLKAYQKNIVYRLKSELKENLKPCVIFSSEHIQARLQTDQEVYILKEILTSIGFDEFNIIIYLRRPSDLASSLYSTAIKTGSTRSCPPSPGNKYFDNACNHKNTLQRFGSVFGTSSIMPRIFDKSELKNGSLIDDFLDAISFPACSAFIVPKSKNESLSPIAIEILRRFNRRVPRFANGKSNPVRGNIVGIFETYFSGNGKYLMPETIYQEYEEIFQESNEWVRENYFPQKNALFSKKRYPVDKLIHIDINEDQLDWISETLTDTWIKKQTGSAFQNLLAKVKLAVLILLLVKASKLAPIIYKITYRK
jgi:hypothetical protein